MTIALSAHDKRKELLVQFCIAYSGVLKQHNLCGTHTTGGLVSEATGLPVKRFFSAAQGGEQQIGARVSYNEVDILLFFRDPLSTPTDSENDLLHLCDLHNIPVATNIATAEVLIHGLERGDLDWRDIVRPPAKRG